MSNPNDYTIGWICAIRPEYVAARAFLDEEHEGPGAVSPNDNNAYTLGKIGKHNVVIAVLPDGQYGISTASNVARDMMHSFHNIRVGLMVGIGGGAPSKNHDIRLGDIVVSAPREGKGGVFQYDFGKTIQDRSFRPTGFLNQPPSVLLTAVTVISGQYESDGHSLEEEINDIFRKKPRLRNNYSRPDPSSDILYRSEVVHSADSDSGCVPACGTDLSKLILRSERTQDEDNPTIHYGIVASGNQLMKDASVRDRLATEENILCFEMEAAGLMNHFPCLVIRGICDYSDSHKNKEWQGYAAMVAAAYAKDLLRRIAPSRVEAEKKIGDILSGNFRA
jgi:nucleoside phosphorylase